MAAHCKADLMTECMKKKKNTNIIRWLSFSFFGRKWTSIYVFVSLSAVNGILFSSAFLFTAKNEKNAFRSTSSIHHKNRSWSWSWDAKSWSWSWSWTLGLVLVLVLVLKKVLITSLLNSSSGLWTNSGVYRLHASVCALWTRAVMWVTLRKCLWKCWYFNRPHDLILSFA